jgi:hypothetical protein
VRSQALWMVLRYSLHLAAVSLVLGMPFSQFASKMMFSMLISSPRAISGDSARNSILSCWQHGKARIELPSSSPILARECLNRRVHPPTGCAQFVPTACISATFCISGAMKNQ